MIDLVELYCVTCLTFSIKFIMLKITWALNAITILCRFRWLYPCILNDDTNLLSAIYHIFDKGDLKLIWILVYYIALIIWDMSCAYNLENDIRKFILVLALVHFCKCNYVWIFCETIKPLFVLFLFVLKRDYDQLIDAYLQVTTYKCKENFFPEQSSIQPVASKRFKNKHRDRHDTKQDFILEEEEENEINTKVHPIYTYLENPSISLNKERSLLNASINKAKSYKQREQVQKTFGKEDEEED